MNGSAYRGAAAVTAAACTLLAVTACTSSSSASSKSAGSSKPPSAAKRDAKGSGTGAPYSSILVSVGTAGDGPLLHAPVPAAPRTFGAHGLDPVHTVRIQQTQWEGSLRARTVSGVLDWTGKGYGELLISAKAGDDADEATAVDPSGAVRIRLVGGAVYADMGAVSAKDRHGDHRRWVKASEDDMAGMSSLSVQNFSPRGTLTSVQQLPTIAEVGAGTFRGVRATHYRSTLSAATLAQVPASRLSAEEAESLAESMERAGVSVETVDVWVSKDGLPLELTVTDETDYGDLKAVTDYTDYGLAVTVKAPPAYDTASSDELDELDGEE